MRYENKRDLCQKLMICVFIEIYWNVPSNVMDMLTISPKLSLLSQILSLEIVQHSKPNLIIPE